MSQENVEVVRRQFEAFERGLDAVTEFWHPEIEWRAVEGAADDVGVIHGEAGLRHYYEDWIEIFEQLRAEVQEVIFAEGERVACVIRNSGRARASGVRTGGRYYVVCTLREGRIASGREYATRAEALEAVGLRE
ncbi:MAG: nuclear transport factor 2 family protein [Solirubrobacteraceae bacterium]